MNREFFAAHQPTRICCFDVILRKREPRSCGESDEEPP
jgi:hypothetical protein